MGYSPWDCKELDTTEHAGTTDSFLVIPKSGQDQILSRH